jgi:ubiquinone/menaquinone biosynthesis C-methylase UbiE
MGEDLTPSAGESGTGSGTESGTETGSGIRHRLFTWWYPKVAAATDRLGFAEVRRKALAGLAGEVVEVGPGHGPNFGFYPAAVTRIVAVEPDAHMRGLAAAASRTAGVPAEVVAGSAERIPAGDGSFDAAVVTLVLCSVRDQQAALREIRRVLRPGGRLHFLEHVRAASGPVAGLQRALDASRLWPLVAGGCHCARDTAASIEQAGFALERCERFAFPDTRLQRPTGPHILGTAIASAQDL